MKILKYNQFINEGWFSSKTKIEKVQDEVLNINDVEKIKNNIEIFLDNYKKYKLAFKINQNIENSKQYRYLKLTIENYYKLTIEIYKLVKLSEKNSDKININTIIDNSIIEQLYEQISGVIMFDYTLLLKKTIKLLIDSVYYLNRISSIIDDIDYRIEIKSEKANVNNIICTKYKFEDTLKTTSNKYNL